MTSWLKSETVMTLLLLYPLPEDEALLLDCLRDAVRWVLLNHQHSDYDTHKPSEGAPNKIQLIVIASNVALMCRMCSCMPSSNPLRPSTSFARPRKISFSSRGSGSTNSSSCNTSTLYVVFGGCGQGIS